MAFNISFSCPGFLGHIESHTVGTGIQPHLMKIPMHIDIGHDTAAEGIILQVVDHTIHLIHHPLLILVLHPHLITVCLADGPLFIRPLVPDVAVQVMNIVGLLLPNPQHLVRGVLQGSAPQGHDGKLPGQIVPVYHAKLLDGICRSAVLPMGAHLLPSVLVPFSRMSRHILINRLSATLIVPLSPCYLVTRSQPRAAQIFLSHLSHSELI